jgi:uncharacterized membrane protein YgcG
LADESILNFNSDITVNKNASLDVIESITVNAENKQINHGIYRDFPTIYRDKHGLEYHVDFTIKNIKLDDYTSDYHTQSMNKGIRIYIGSKNSYVPAGEHTYQIMYNVTRELGFFENFDELYWNVTGNGWVFPIEKASALVRLPAEIDKDQLSTSGYTGYQGATGKDYKSAVISGNEVEFVTTRSLNSNEGLTIAVGWPKGLVETPASIDKAHYFLTDNLGIFSLIILFIYFFAVWWCVGRDPKKGIIIPLYESRSNCSPALMRYIVKTRYDYKAFAAALTSLAVKGAMKIEEIKSDSWFSSNDGITLHLLDKEVDASADEKTVIEAIAVYGLNVTLRKGETLASSITSTQQAKLNGLGDKFFSRHLAFTFIGVLITAVLWFVNFGVKGQGILDTPQSMILVLGAVVFTIIFGWLNQQPTQEGRKILDEAAGMREYLKIGEQYFLKKIQEGVMTPELFEKLLPYAIALDLESEWSKKFDLAVEKAQGGWSSHQSSWYAGNSNNSFAQSVAGLGDAISSASTPPGSSSGSGGGGSSGGGGGGGGGGGW